ncbi:hypothetical protein ACHAXR_009336 [Thalassiosira sp. AJA248-18]
MTSEGLHEIDAAKQRLAAAKAHVSSAAKNMDSAKAMMEAAKAMMASAQSMLDSSAKEAEEAEKCLKESEKRWEVIDVDGDGVPDSPQKKRRKVSLSPQQGSGAKTIRGVESESNAVGSNIGTGSEVTTDVSSDTIVVEGAGESEVNGAYKLGARKISGVPVYCKGGRWKGKAMEFALYYRVGPTGGFWLIGVGNANFTRLYRTINPVPVRTDIPPGNFDWVAMKGTTNPAPKLLPGAPSIVHHDGMTVNTVIIEGCGLSEVNGKYSFTKHLKNDGVRSYIREGQWKGKTSNVMLFRFSEAGGKKYWCISKLPCEGQAQINFYCTNCPDDLPPRNGNGWTVFQNAGIAPLPRLKW